MVNVFQGKDWQLGKSLSKSCLCLGRSRQRGPKPPLRLQLENGPRETYTDPSAAKPPSLSTSAAGHRIGICGLRNSRHSLKLSPLYFALSLVNLWLPLETRKQDIVPVSNARLASLFRIEIDCPPCA
jgi:hypothetical protein